MPLNNLMKRILVACSLLAFASFADAQSADPFDVHVADLILLQAKSVQTDMGVSKPQEDRMNQFASLHRDKLIAYDKELRAKKQRPDQRVLIEYLGELKKNVFSQLSPGQIKRLREITLQRVGWPSLTDLQVATRVGMTTGQLDAYRNTFKQEAIKIETVKNKALKAALKKYQNVKAKDKAEAERINKEAQIDVAKAERKALPGLIQMERDRDKKLIGLLNSRQVSNFAALKGKKFDPRVK